jgi:hypothetical protein
MAAAPCAAPGLRVPLQQAELLAIEADFGLNLALGDHCVVADARVQKQ